MLLFCCSALSFPLFVCVWLLNLPLYTSSSACWCPCVCVCVPLGNRQSACCCCCRYGSTVYSASMTSQALPVWPACLRLPFFLWAFPPSLCWHHHKRMRSGPIVAVIGPPMGDPGTYYNIAICSMIECRNTDVGSKSRETGRSGDHIVHHQATEPTERTGRYKRDGVCESASTCILHSSMVKKFPHSHARVLIASEIQLINRNATHT